MPLAGIGPRDVRAALRAAAEEAGRDPDSLEIVPVWVRAEQSTLNHYASVGITRAILGLPAAKADEVLPILDGYQKLGESLTS
jgi:hypothetical protein